MPRTSIKGQVLADLVAEFTEPPVEVVVEERNMDAKSVGAISMPGPPCWKLYVNGVTNQKGSGVGLVLESPEKTIDLGTRPRITKPSMRPCYKEWPWYRKWEEKH